MRFRRYHRFGAFQDTNRKRAALARKQRLEREAVPLLANLVAEQQPSAGRVMAQRATDWDRWQQEMRDRRAADWRRARADLGRSNRGAAIRTAWQSAPYPADPVYLLGLLHSVRVGRIDPDAPPWDLSQLTTPHGTRHHD